jgi:hypothetical protein
MMEFKMSKKVWDGKIEKDEFVQLQESSAQVMGLRKEAKSLDDVKDVGDACKILGFSPEQCKIAKNEKLSDEDMFNQLVKAGVSRENAKKLMLWYGVEPDEKWLKVKKESSNDVQEARKWWNSLSTSEQNDLVKKYYSMWDYYGLSKAHEIVSSSSKRLIYIWKKTSGMTNESVKKEAEGDGSDFVVSVGNVGNIECETYEKALETYELFVGKSKANIGRAGGEDVVLLVDGEIDKEYFGTLNNEVD